MDRRDPSIPKGREVFLFHPFCPPPPQHFPLQTAGFWDWRGTLPHSNPTPQLNPYPMCVVTGHVPHTRSHILCVVFTPCSTDLQKRGLVNLDHPNLLKGLAELRTHVFSQRLICPVGICIGQGTSIPRQGRFFHPQSLSGLTMTIHGLSHSLALEQTFPT